NGSRQEGYRTKGPEVESANIKIASRKEPLIEGYRSPSKSPGVRSQQPHGKNIPMLGMRPEKSDLGGGPDIVGVPAKQATTVFQRQAKGSSVGWVIWIVDRAVVVAGDQFSRVVFPESSITRSIVLLRGRPPHVDEIVASGVVNSGCGRVIELESEPDPGREFERMTSIDTEPSPRLLVIETVFKAIPCGQVVRVQAIQFPRLIILIVAVEQVKTHR